MTSRPTAAKAQEDGRIGFADRATHEPDPQAVPALRVGIPLRGERRGSSAEHAIRDDLVSFLHANYPAARVVHELVVGTCRADVAAVEEQRITLFEIKSSKDTLGRLERQVETFRGAAHRVAVVADQRWFETPQFSNGRRVFRPTDTLRNGSNGVELWCWPRGIEGAEFYSWQFPYWGDTRPEPHAAKLLGLLWRAELIAEAATHQIATGKRPTVATLIREMAWHMTGQEIARAVCRQLRTRPFPEADAPVGERLAA